MNRRTGLIIAGVVIVLIGLSLLYVRRLTTLPPLTISYSTAQSAMPAGAACAGGSDESTGVAKEILDAGQPYHLCSWRAKPHAG